MVANIELEKTLTHLNCTVMMAHQAALEVSREHTCTDCPYVWRDEPNQIKIAMSSDEPRPVKIYFIQLCAQQRRISDCTDAHSDQKLSCPLQ